MSGCSPGGYRDRVQDSLDQADSPPAARWTAPSPIEGELAGKYFERVARALELFTTTAEHVRELRLERRLERLECIVATGWRYEGPPSVNLVAEKAAERLAASAVYEQLQELIREVDAREKR